jgi:nucleoside-diphosphate-sugar epimerase
MAAASSRANGICGSWPNIVPGDRGQRLSFIYVDDIVLALTQAALQGERLANDEARPDQGVYFVALDEHPTMGELGHLAGIALGGIPARPLVVPAWLSQLTGHVNDFLARLTMQPKLITSDKMREALAGSWLCSSDKAKRHWGFTCRIGLADGFQKTVQWYRDQRWL